MENQNYFGYEQLLDDWFDEGFKKSYDFKVNYYSLPELDWCNLSGVDLIHELEYVLAFIVSKTTYKDDEIKFFLSDEKFNTIQELNISPWTNKTILDYMQDNYKRLRIHKISSAVQLSKDNNPSFCFAIFVSKEWMEKNFYNFSIN